MTPGAAGLHQPSRPWNHLSPLILILALARLWVMPLWSSFWVDEMGTVFVVQRGADHPSFAVAPQVPQSIYYLLPRAANALFGVSEFGWRLASLLAMAAALLLIAWLAVRLVDPGAAWFAAFACLALRGFDYQAADARPYGLGTLVACACLWFLVRWLDRARWPDALAFVVLGALLWRVQLIFWPFYLVLVSYAASRLAHRDSSVSWKAASAVFALLGLSLVPTLLQAAALYRQAGAHVVVALPTLRDLVLSLKLGLVAVCVAGAWVAHAVAGRSAFATRKPPPRSSSRETVVLIASWWLCQPVCLFAFSRVTGNSVFVARYLWLSLPGAALAATWAENSFPLATGNPPPPYWASEACCSMASGRSYGPGTTTPTGAAPRARCGNWSSIPIHRSSAPARSSRPGRPYGALTIPYQASSTRTCPSIRYPAKSCCSRSKILPRPKPMRVTSQPSGSCCTAVRAR